MARATIRIFGEQSETRKKEKTHARARKESGRERGRKKEKRKTHTKNSGRRRGRRKESDRMRRGKDRQASKHGNSRTQVESEREGKEKEHQR